MQTVRWYCALLLLAACNALPMVAEDARPHLLLTRVGAEEDLALLIRQFDVRGVFEELAFIVDHGSNRSSTGVVDLGPYNSSDQYFVVAKRAADSLDASARVLWAAPAVNGTQRTVVSAPNAPLGFSADPRAVVLPLLSKPMATRHRTLSAAGVRGTAPPIVDLLRLVTAAKATEFLDYLTGVDSGIKTRNSIAQDGQKVAVHRLWPH